MDEARDLIASALRKRAANGGRHLHHSACVHNMAPAEQVRLRGKTVEWWERVIGPLPEQITPEQWETDPPECGWNPVQGPQHLDAVTKELRETGKY